MVKNPSANAENVGSIPGSERFLGGRMATASNILDEKNSMVRGAWQAVVHGVTKSQMQLSDWAHVC